MKMPGDPRAGNVSDVHPKVKAVRFHGLLKRRLRNDQNIKKFGAFGRIELGNARNMTLRNDHQVPVIVRVAIKNNRMVDSTEKD